MDFILKYVALKMVAKVICIKSAKNHKGQEHKSQKIVFENFMNDMKMAIFVVL